MRMLFLYLLHSWAIELFHLHLTLFHTHCNLCRVGGLSVLRTELGETAICVTFCVQYLTWVACDVNYLVSQIGNH